MTPADRNLLFAVARKVSNLSNTPLKETTMAKVLKCGDVFPGCKEEPRGESEHDVLRKAAEHAKTAHHMDSIPPDVLSKVKGAIHDEGEARTQKAGASN